MKPLSIGEAAKKLRVSVATLRRWEKSGRISATRMASGHRRYTTADLDQIISPKYIHQAPSPSPTPVLQTPIFYAFPRPIFSKAQKNILTFSGLATLISLAIIILRITPFTSPSYIEGDTSQVLASQTVLEDLALSVNVPAKFNKGLTVGDTIISQGNITAPNIIYSLKAGDGINITTGQTPAISTNLQTFKTIKVGSSSFSAGSNTDTLTFAAGDNASVSINTSDKKITFSATVPSTGFTDDGTMIRLTTAGDIVSLGSATGSAKLSLESSDGRDILTASSAGNLLLKLSQSGTLTVAGNIISSGSFAGFWQRDAGSLAPANITDDLVLGATSTSSAKFQIFGLTGSATMSGNLTFSSAATIATTNMQTLTLGDANTGDIAFSQAIRATQGGTGQSTYTTGDILYSSAANTLAKLGIGGANQVLAVSSGIPGWVDSSSLADSTWQRVLGVLAPRNITDDVLIGGTATASALLRISGTTGNLVTTGSTTLGDAIASDTVTFNSRIASIFEPTTGSLYDIGSSARRWATVYGDTGNFTNFSTETATISGTTAADFLINSDNVTADTENSSLTFERGTPATNVQFLWNAATKLLSTNTPSFAILGDTGIAYSGQAALIVNQVQAQDILTASASGVTKLTLTNAGNLVLGASSYLNFGTTSGTSGYGLRDNSGAIEIKSSGGDWSAIAANLWQRLAGTLSPANITDDLLVGGTATSSALVKLAGTSGANSFINTGNFGIGTLTPSKNLDVSGAAAFRNKFNYQQTVTLTNGGGTLTNYDVLIERDTATLISAGKMQSDCDDMRFTDADQQTPLTYWLEQGCNTADTQIWVRVPSIANGAKNIYMVYGNSNVSSASQTFSGNFISMFNASCGAGWTQISALNNKFPRGNTSYGGSGGADTHTVAISGTSSQSGGKQTWNSCSNSVAYWYHTHTYSATSGSANNLPPYVNVVFCSKNAPELIPTSGIVFHSSSLVSGWSNVTALNTNFTRGSTTYGGTGGSSAVHNHTIPAMTTSGPSAAVSTCQYDIEATSGGQTHSTGATTTANNANTSLPPYEDFIPASPDQARAYEQGALVAFSAAPPLGWTRKSSLDSGFPRGNSTAGGTGGAATHTHTYSIVTSAATSDTSGENAAGTGTSNDGHTHTLSGTPSGTNVPAYMDVLYYTKNTMSVTIGYSAEQVGSSSPIQVLYDDTTTNLGVGQITPLWKLHVTDTQAATASGMIENLSAVGSNNPTALILRLGNDGTNPDTGDRFINFMSGYSAILGKIQGNGSGGLTYATAGVDFAEYFTRGVGDDFSPGTAVCHTATGVSPCLADEIDKFAGIISTAPAFLGGQEGPDKVAVGLVGQIPAKVATDSAALSPGDKITLAGTGLVAKADTNQPAIGHALSSWDPANPTPTILVLVSPLTNLSLTPGPSIDSASFTNLSVTGSTLLSDTNITGKLHVGLLAFDDLAASISSLTGLITVKGDLAVTGLLHVLGSSAGTAVIPAGTTSLTLDSQLVSTASAVFATADEPVPIGTQVTEPGKFTIKIPSSLPADLKVNWWIVN